MQPIKGKNLKALWGPLESFGGPGEVFPVPPLGAPDYRKLTLTNLLTNTTDMQVACYICRMMANCKTWELLYSDDITKIVKPVLSLWKFTRKAEARRYLTSTKLALGR